MNCKSILAAFFCILFLSTAQKIVGQDSNGGAISTHESYLYGRFEVEMQSASGDGIVSSFFLYNINTNCNWPSENNEIDVEMTGNDELLYFTTHHPDPNQTWYYGENFDLDFNPHEGMHRYTIEWEPDIIRWFVDDNLIYTQNDNNTLNLNYPMAILMNLWAAEAESWVGVWDPEVLPRYSHYNYVSYSSYTPGEGNTGSGDNFTFEWQDDFDIIDSDRWKISDFTGFSDLTVFRKENVQSYEGILTLTLSEPDPSPEEIPVTFSVNMNEYELENSDVVYLNSTFNNWCGTCNPMFEEDGIWSITIPLNPERYEFLFTINGWEEIGNAPIGSECDAKPCDEYANYGVLVSVGSDPIVLDTFCWEECVDCIETSVDQDKMNPERKLVKIVDVLGREIDTNSGHFMVYIYDDGSFEKIIGPFHQDLNH